MNKNKIMFHAINHVGLGHLTRTLTIAKWINWQIPNLEIMFLVEDESRLLENESFPWIRIPSIYDFRSKAWRSISEEKQNTMITGIVSGILESFRPDIFIYDSVIWYPLYRAVQQFGCKQVFIARMGQITRHIFQTRQETLEGFDKILVPHSVDELQNDQKLFEQFLGKLEIVGPILKKSVDEIIPQKTRTHYKIPEDCFCIVITAGGGGWEQTKKYFRLLVSALEYVNNGWKQKNIKIFLITGPHFNDSVIFDPKVLDITIFDYIPDLMDLMAIANLVICQGGLTLSEVAEIGVPTICIPSINADDQVSRVDYFSSKFYNIIKCQLVYDEIVKHISETMNSKRFYLPLHSFPSESFLETRLKVVKAISNLLI